MEKLLNLDCIAKYNELLGVETLHPLVAVVDLKNAQKVRNSRKIFGFYAVFLKDTKCGEMRYGRQYYDYQEGSIVCLAPGQIVGVEDNGQDVRPKGMALVFHPDLLRGTHLGQHIREYGFFSYEANEALHLSERERKLVVDSMEKIAHELEHSVDRLSKRLITGHIELLLDYCLRFYERQFITRQSANRDILTRFERLLDDYFASDGPRREGLPTVRYFASQLCLSPNYFGDLIKKETGLTAQEHISRKVIETAKDRILNPELTISQVAYELGFQYPQHLTRLFKKSLGMTPTEYRSQI